MITWTAVILIIICVLYVFMHVMFLSFSLYRLLFLSCRWVLFEEITYFQNNKSLLSVCRIDWSNSSRGCHAISWTTNGISRAPSISSYDASSLQMIRFVGGLMAALARPLTLLLTLSTNITHFHPSLVLLVLDVFVVDVRSKCKH